MAELQIENKVQYEPIKKISIDEVSKRISTVESKIKDDETYAREDSFKILSEIFDYRTIVASDLDRTLEKIGRKDIVDMFQRLTITAEQYVVEELNERLNDMLRLATKMAEIAAIGAIAAYLELKTRQEEIEISNLVPDSKRDERTAKNRVKLEIGNREKEILRKYMWFLKRKWDRFRDEYGVDDPKLIARTLDRQGILEEGERILLEIKIAKALNRDDDKGLVSYLTRYAEITNLKIITVMLNRGIKGRDIVRMFRGVFRILKVK